MTKFKETRSEELSNPVMDQLNVLQKPIADNYGYGESGPYASWQWAMNSIGSEGAGGPTVSSPYGDGISLVASSIALLMEKVDNMADRISNVEDTLLSIEGMLSVEEPDNEGESLVEVTKEEAKQMIVELFHKEGVLDYTQIMSTFHLDLELIVDICAELEETREIEGVN